MTGEFNIRAPQTSIDLVQIPIGAVQLPIDLVQMPISRVQIGIDAVHSLGKRHPAYWLGFDF